MRATTYAVLLAGLAASAALVLPFAHALQAPDQLPFITTWKTETANEIVTIPLVGSGMTIHWGDGASSTGVSGTATHAYANPGTYAVSVYGGLEAISLDYHPDASKLVSIDQWGDVSWTTMEVGLPGRRQHGLRGDRRSGPLAASPTCLACSPAPPPSTATSPPGTSPR